MRDDPPRTYDCDLGDSVPIRLATYDLDTGDAADAVSVACEVTRPDGTADPVAMASTGTGLYRGYYHTAGLAPGTYRGTLTTTFADSVAVVDRFRLRVRAVWP